MPYVHALLRSLIASLITSFEDSAILQKAGTPCPLHARFSESFDIKYFHIAAKLQKAGAPI